VGSKADLLAVIARPMDFGLRLAPQVVSPQQSASHRELARKIISFRSKDEMLPLAHTILARPNDDFGANEGKFETQCGYPKLGPTLNCREIRRPTPREIVFIDPSVAGAPALVAGLRPGVPPMLLDGAMPACQEMASRLRGHVELDAIHIIVHGSSGKLEFSAGPLSKSNIDHHGDDLAAIGRALRPEGDLRLWSCCVGEGTLGRLFLDALSRAAGAPVAATTRLVGAFAKGGTWELETWPPRGPIRSPLTDDGMSAYAGVFVANYINIKYSAATKANNYYVVANVRGNPTIIGNFAVPKCTFAGEIAVSVNIEGPLTVAGSSAAMSAAGSVGLFTQSNADNKLGYDLATTSILGAAGATVSCVPRRLDWGP
jgi:Domain of unknown function (DUF4347)